MDFVRALVLFAIVTITTSITLPGLEEMSSKYYSQKTKLPTEAAIENFIRGGADFNSIISNKNKHPSEAEQKPVTKMATGEDATLLTMLKRLNGVELIELLNKAFTVGNSAENVYKNNEMSAYRIPKQHDVFQGRGKQNAQSTSLLNINTGENQPKDSAIGMKLTPGHTEPNYSNVYKHQAIHPSRINAQHSALQSPNNYESNNAENKISLTNEANGSFEKHVNTEAVQFQKNNGNSNPSGTGGETVNNVNALNTYSSAQQYTNPMSMLAAGMGSPGSNSKTQQVIATENQGDNKGSGFDPNRLMSSWTSTSGFNPAKYNVGQNFISADEWTRYANRPTGYAGIKQKNSNQTPSNTQPSSMLPQKNAKSSQTSQNLVQSSVLSAKMNFIPNSMILPNSKLQNMDIKLSFDPDRLNILQGTFRPGQFAAVSGSNAGNSQQPHFNADAVNQRLMGLSDSKQPMQNVQSSSHNAKKSGFQTPFSITGNNANSFNSAGMSFSPNLFLGPLSQNLAKHSQRSATARSTESLKIRPFSGVIESETNGDLDNTSTNISAENVTIQPFIVPTPTVNFTVQAGKDTPPTKTPVISSFAGFSGFDPDEINKPMTYNPSKLPGMSMGTFQFNTQQHQQKNTNNTAEQQYQYLLGFNPSQVNNAKMSFDINSQLGIEGKSQSYNGQAFTGGYDPIKTNIMAIQNPFAQSNDNQTQSFTAGKVSGFESAFVGSFNPNNVNQGIMQMMVNSKDKNKTAGGGGFFTMAGMGFGMSAYGGNFDPSSVNNAVFNPNDVNKVQMHFNPSDMLEKNPGYDADKALGYKFNPNHINNMQMHFQPSFIPTNNGVAPAADNATNSSNSNSAGSGFVPGLLGGGGKQNEIPLFNPDSVNNAHMHFAPLGVNSQAVIQTSNNQTSNTTAAPNQTVTLFNPNNVNNAKMSLNPGGTVQSDSNKIADLSNSETNPGYSHNDLPLEVNRKQEESVEAQLQMLFNKR